MVKKVLSPENLDEIVYKIGTNGVANVWIRQNIEEIQNVYEVSDENGEVAEQTETDYQADEVYSTVSPDLISVEEISADSEFFFSTLSDAPDGANADYLSVENTRIAKRAEISDTCQQVIEAGIDVMINGEVEHFSLTQYDQTNLIGLQAMLMSGMEYIPYHRDGAQCVYYSASDAQKILTKAFEYKTYHTTYCNSMFTWIASVEKASEISAIHYGDAIPVEYQSEVLKDLLKG